VAAPAAQRSPALAGAIYGQILATAVLAGLSEDAGITSRELFADVAVTALVFWLAHVYAQALAARIGLSRGLTFSDVREVAAEEWPMVWAATPTLLALGLGWAGALSRDAAVTLGIGLGVAGLVAWGFLIARRSGMSRLGTLGAVMLNAAFGLAIVGLKIAVK
jgi:hypothetical protein